MNHFAPLHESLRARPALATLGLFAPRNEGLRRHLETRLMDGDGFVAEPVIEALHEWEAHSAAMGDLPYLHSDVKNALDAPGVEHPQHQFPLARKPYAHQHAAWQELTAPAGRNVLVSTGTASGKTECFLVPILDHLARARDAEGGRVRGVRALILYPLNALINSQRERLAAWAAPFDGDVRFCLYNGGTPEEPGPARDRKPYEVGDRTTLRADPPPVLVTNVTMLEYMLTRSADAPILDASRGKLRWVVLDEAHTYLGSAAAEVALLLRRVMHAFGVEPGQVRFVATSATIGTAADTGQLARYLADLAGVDESRVRVITGTRLPPPLPPERPGDAGTTPTDALALCADGQATAADRGELLASVPAVRRLVGEMRRPLRLSRVRELLGVADDAAALRALDAMADATVARPGGSAVPLLPVRGHWFTRTLGGLWACANHACRGRAEHGPTAPWPFGRVYATRLLICPSCGSPVCPVVLCRQCGQSLLSAAEDDDGNFVPRDHIGPGEDDGDGEDDQVRDQRFDAAADDEGEGAGDDGAARRAPYPPVMLTDPDVAGGPPKVLNADDGRFTCPCCGDTEGPRRPLFRPVRAGTPFYLNASLPALIEHQGRPLGGRDDRRLITFTDSRQGTARNALRINAETYRRFVRSFVYHTLWSRQAPDGRAEELARDVAQRRALVEMMGQKPEMATFLAQARKDLEECERRLAAANGLQTVAFKEMVGELAQRPEVSRFRADAGEFESGYGPSDAHDVARMLLLREFFTRPKRQNSLETLGLAALTYPGLDALRPPHEWPGDTTTWQRFLAFCTDFVARANGCWNLPRWYGDWVGPFSRVRGLARPDANAVPDWVQRWPTGDPRSSRSRAVIMLRALLGPAPVAEALVTELLHRAFLALCEGGVLTRNVREANVEVFGLSADAVVLAPVRSALACPVINRVFTGLPRDYSAYAGSDRPPATCQAVSMPRLP
ncbi:MAG TPA: DEAD/DEAH box helicase, partial [Humisphaera sp.]